MRVTPALALCACIVIFAPQRPAAQGPAAQGPAGRGGGTAAGGPAPAGQRPGQGRGREGVSPASQRRPQTVTPQSYPAAQVQAGQRVFSAQCGFCHGRDATGGEGGTDLTRSTLVAEDVRGDKIGTVVRSGRVEKGMPAFHLSDADVAAIVAFIHDSKATAETLLGARRTVGASDLQTGNAEAGKRYFSGACARCHSPDRDLAGVAKRFEGLALLQRMLYPAAGRGGGAAPAPAQVTVTLASGQTVTGKLAYRDEFTITLTDASGWSRSWPTNQVTFTVNDPLQAHVDQLGKYTDDDMHNVLAYLQTLR
ncbi:MAG: c-type cytochrome [Acidobacteria bacterium]|nr:c-type cytochrome [Acidobacteriota bacterium]MBI3263279.1 c-type cytochrome [Acidobacteriota bacterium]